MTHAAAESPRESAHPRLGIVIPTRNRSDLAKRTLASVLEQVDSATAVVVSDNSNDEDERAALSRYCDAQTSPALTYVCPPSPMAMSDHWEWAAREAMRLLHPSHLMYLTDRTLLRPGRMRVLSQLLRETPDVVITFRGDDMVDDAASPVALRAGCYSGQVRCLSSAELLESVASLSLPGFSSALPKMMNSIVPSDVIDAVRAKYGAAFRSISPDFCFAFQCLSVVDEVRFLDASPTIHYAQNSSNGRALITGVYSKDARDFRLEHGGELLFSHTPLPSVLFVTNAVIEEYCLVAEQSRSSRFPPLDRDAYLSHLWEFAALMEEDAKRDEIRRLVEAAGFRPAPEADRPTFRQRLRSVARDPGPSLRWRFWRIAASRQLQFVWPLLSVIGVRPATSVWFRFSSTDAALRFAQRCPMRVAERFSY